MYGILGLIILILDIVAIVSLLTGYSSPAHKLIWTIVILLFPVIGVILYFLLGRSYLDA